MARCGGCDTAIIGLEGRGVIQPKGMWAQVGDFWALRSAWAWTVRTQRAAEEDEALLEPSAAPGRGTPTGDTLMDGGTPQWTP